MGFIAGNASESRAFNYENIKMGCVLVKKKKKSMPLSPGPVYSCELIPKNKEIE